MNMIPIQGARLLSNINTLAQFGKQGTGVTRLSFSREDVDARNWLSQLMNDAGLKCAIDGVGNVYGQSPNCSQAILLGSHTDTVPLGGRLDGAMGVLYGIEIAQALTESGLIKDIGIDVISFADEESTFIGTLGSRSFVRMISPEDIAAAHNLDGTSLSSALSIAGYAGRPTVHVDADRHIAYLEAHIEQGPRLEANSKRIGIVTSIVGIRRIEVLFNGQADHAGTTPMAMRKDAGMALIRCANRIVDGFEVIRTTDSVWNLGHMSVQPGAGNVVPSEAKLLIEFRDSQTSALDHMERIIHKCAYEIDASGPVLVQTKRIMALEPAHMNAELGKIIEKCAKELGATSMHMPSGAGHDAQHLTDHVPTAMMFIPSIDGRSHDTSENSDDSDILLGLEVLAKTVAKISSIDN